MMRTLLTTTALAVLLAGGAVAQEAATTATPPAGVLGQGYTATDSDNLATEIIGKQVYSSAAADAEHIGDINNLVLGEDGNVQAVIIGVGGFLGIGEKNVAVSMDELQFVVAQDNTERYVLETTKEALNAAPAFEWQDDQPSDTAATTPAAPAATDPNAAPADTAATTTQQPADPNAAPADTAAATTPQQPADPNAAPADTAAATTTEQPAATPEDETATGAVSSADSAATPAPGSAMDPLNREGLTEFDEAQLTAEELIGTNVYGTNDEHIGAIGDLALNEDGTVDAVIIDFGGFLGIGTKPVAVAYEDLQFLTDENNNRSLILPITREQMDAAPAFNKDTYTAERDQQRVVVNAQS